MSLPDHEMEPCAALASSSGAHSDAGGAVLHAESRSHSQVDIVQRGWGCRSTWVSNQVTDSFQLELGEGESRICENLFETCSYIISSDPVTGASPALMILLSYIKWDDQASRPK